MHTYRSSNQAGKQGWQVGFDAGTGSTAGGGNFTPIGPHFEHQHEAAAYAAFMNGGKYEPAAVEDILKVDKKLTPEQEAAQAEYKRDEEKAKQEEKNRKRPPDYPQEGGPEDNREPHAKEPQRASRAHPARAKQHVRRKAPAKSKTRHKR